MNFSRSGLLPLTVRDDPLAEVTSSSQHEAYCLLALKRWKYAMTSSCAPKEHQTYGKELHCTQVCELVGWRSSMGKTALHVAASTGECDMLIELLNAGCDINEEDHEGLTPLLCAILTNQFDAVMILLQHVNCDLNYVSKRYGTAVHFSILKENDEILKVLLTAGADVSILGPGQKSTAYLAAAQGTDRALYLLGEFGASMNSKNQKGLSPLHAAVIGNQVEKVHYLLKQGASVDRPDNAGNFPIHYAVRTKNREIIDALLKSGSPIDCMNRSFECPLHIAIRDGDLPTIRQLVNAGCDVNISKPDRNGEPLHLLVTVHKDTYHADFCDILDVLLDGGCRINTQAYRTLETPLYRAVSMQKREIAETLIRHGADTNLSRPFDITALQVSCRNQDLHVTNLLLHSGINWKRERWFGQMSYFNNQESKEIKELIEKWRTQPVSLQYLSRIAIRKHFKDGLLQNILRLPVPLSVKKFLMFSDICDKAIPADTMPWDSECSISRGVTQINCQHCHTEEMCDAGHTGFRKAEETPVE